MRSLRLSIRLGAAEPIAAARRAIRSVELRDAIPLAESIVNSAPVIHMFGSCEFDELSADGQLWVAAIVREALAFAAAARI